MKQLQVPKGLHHMGLFAFLSIQASTSMGMSDDEWQQWSSLHQRHKDVMSKMNEVCQDNNHLAPSDVFITPEKGHLQISLGFLLV